MTTKPKKAWAVVSERNRLIVDGGGLLKIKKYRIYKTKRSAEVFCNGYEKVIHIEIKQL